jgi:hypothetical protein
MAIGQFSKEPIGDYIDRVDAAGADGNGSGGDAAGCRGEGQVAAWVFAASRRYVRCTRWFCGFSPEAELAWGRLGRWGTPVAGLGGRIRRGAPEPLVPQWLARCGGETCDGGTCTAYVGSGGCWRAGTDYAYVVAADAYDQGGGAGFAGVTAECVQDY